jgi:hypothetical protein
MDLLAFFWYNYDTLTWLVLGHNAICCKLQLIQYNTNLGWKFTACIHDDSNKTFKIIIMLNFSQTDRRRDCRRQNSKFEFVVKKAREISKM